MDKSRLLRLHFAFVFFRFLITLVVVSVSSRALSFLALCRLCEGMGSAPSITWLIHTTRHHARRVKLVSTRGECEGDLTVGLGHIGCWCIESKLGERHVSCHSSGTLTTPERTGTVMGSATWQSCPVTKTTYKNTC